MLLPLVKWISWISWGGAPQATLSSPESWREECFVWGVAMGIAGSRPSSHLAQRTRWPTDPVHPPLAMVVGEGKAQPGSGLWKC